MKAQLFKKSVLFIGFLSLAAVIGCSDETGRAATAAVPQPSTAMENRSPVPSQPSPVAASPVAASQTPLPDDPEAGHSPPVPEQSASVPEPETDRLKSCGNAEFGRGAQTAQLPLRCIRANYGLDGPNGTPKLVPQDSIKVESYAIPSDFQKSLAAYWMNLGDNEHGLLLLAPKDWSLLSADVGANGSYAIRLINPDDPEQFVDYFDQGGCQGCLIPNIGAYFPDLKTWAEEQGYEVDPQPGIVKRTLLTPNLMAYGKQPAKSGYESNGVAYQEHGGGGGIFRSEEVQLRAADKAIATVILNLFVAQHPDPVN